MHERDKWPKIVRIVVICPEALRLYFGTQLTPIQDGERITDEEIAEIMAAPSPLDEDYHRTFFDGLDPEYVSDEDEEGRS